jgi:actin-like protein 6A
VGADRLRVPELLLQPGLLAGYPGAEGAAAKAGGPSPPLSLVAAVLEAASTLDVDVRREVLPGVVLTGGTSLLAGLRERLERGLIEAAPQAAKIKVVAPTNPVERRFSSWIGGSILSSLGSFHQMWMSKREYEEHGASLIHRKAP